MSENITQQMPNDDLKRILARLDSIDVRLEKLETRAYDTKPIWEQALAELFELGKRMDSLDRRFSVLNDYVLQNRADYRRVERRVAELEPPSLSRHAHKAFHKRHYASYATNIH